MQTIFILLIVLGRVSLATQGQNLGCSAQTLLQHPALRQLASNRAMEYILPGFRGYPDEERIRALFAEPKWDPAQYRVYGISEWEDAKRWTLAWAERPQSIEPTGEKPKPTKAKKGAAKTPPVPATPAVAPPSPDALRLRNAFTTGGNRAGLVMTSTFPVEESAGELGKADEKRTASLTFFVPARDRRASAPWSLVIVAPRLPVQP